LKIGAQLYTVNAFLKTQEDIEKSLKRIAASGFKYVQFSGMGGHDVKWARDCADENGLEISVTHSNQEQIKNATEEIIKIHEIYGCKNIGIGSMPQEYIGTVEGIRAFIKDFTPAARIIRDAGMKLHYHNHAFEFANLSGESGFDILMNETDPELWFFLLDTYWVQYAGKSPVKQFYDLKGRIGICHYKDMAITVDNTHVMTPVLDGNLDWAGIFRAAAETGVEYAFIEQDVCYEADPFDCLKRSFDNINAFTLKN